MLLWLFLLLLLLQVLELSREHCFLFCTLTVLPLRCCRYSYSCRTLPIVFLLFEIVIEFTFESQLNAAINFLYFCLLFCSWSIAHLRRTLEKISFFMLVFRSKNGTSCRRRLFKLLLITPLPPHCLLLLRGKKVVFVGKFFVG